MSLKLSIICLTDTRRSSTRPSERIGVPGSIRRTRRSELGCTTTGEWAGNTSLPKATSSERRAASEACSPRVLVRKPTSASMFALSAGKESTRLLATASAKITRRIPTRQISKGRWVAPTTNLTLPDATDFMREFATITEVTCSTGEKFTRLLLVVTLPASVVAKTLPTAVVAERRRGRSR